MQSGSDLFKKIIINGTEVDISLIDNNNGRYLLPGNIKYASVKFVYNDDVTSIPANVFRGITDLKKVYSFPSNITSLADDSFTGTDIDDESIRLILAINPKAYKYPKKESTISCSPTQITITQGQTYSLQNILTLVNGKSILWSLLEYTAGDGLTIDNGRITASGNAGTTTSLTVKFYGNDEYNPASCLIAITITAQINPVIVSKACILKDTESYYWYNDNYIVDIAVDAFMMSNYNMSAKADAGNVTDVKDSTWTDSWTSYSKEKQVLIMKAAIIPYASWPMFYCTKYFKYISNKLQVTFNLWGTNVSETKYIFNEVSLSEYNSNLNDSSYFMIEGAFADLGLITSSLTNKSYRNYVNTYKDSTGSKSATVDSGGNITFKASNGNTTTVTAGNVYGTTTLPHFDYPDLTSYNFIKFVQNASDVIARSPMYRVNRGRIRPLNADNGYGRFSAQSTYGWSGAIGHPFNSLHNSTLVLRYMGNDTGTAADIEEFLEGVTALDLNLDDAASYPSGHSSQTWGVALMLAQIFGTKDLPSVKKYLYNAYMVGVSRAIARFHWNSDIMYGRLCAEMMLPVLNANADLNTGYNYFRSQYPSSALNQDGDYSDSLSDNTYYSEYRTLVSEFGSVEASSNMDKYLYYMYLKAKDALNKLDTDYAFLFHIRSASYPDAIYPDLYPQEGYEVPINGNQTTVKFRGNNTTYNVSGVTKEKIYLSWFMAMCIAEMYTKIASNADSIGNNAVNDLTLIFAKAYLLGGGRELNVYDEYRIDYDPMVLRNAAAIVYAINRGKFSRTAVSGFVRPLYTCRNNNNLMDVNLGFSGTNFSDIYDLGYIVDTYRIFPNAPGPYQTKYGSATRSGVNLKSLKPYQLKTVGNLANGQINLTTGWLNLNQFVVMQSSGGGSTTVLNNSGVGANILSIVIINKSGATLSIEPRFRFSVTKNNTVYRTYSMTDSAHASNSQTEVLIINNDSMTFDIDISGTYGNSDKPSIIDVKGGTIGAAYGKYTSNIIAYINDGSGSSNAFPLPNITGSPYFLGNTTVTVNYGGDNNNGEEENEEDVYITVTIANLMSKNLTFDGKLGIITYGTHTNGYTGYLRFKGKCEAGSDLTIPAGGSRTYRVNCYEDSNQSPAGALGTTFSTTAQRNPANNTNPNFFSNISVYYGGSAFTCNDINYSDTFRRNGTYSTIITSDSHEWSSAARHTHVENGETINTNYLEEIIS